MSYGREIEEKKERKNYRERKVKERK